MGLERLPPRALRLGPIWGRAVNVGDTTVVAAAARKPARSTERRDNREISVPAAEAAAEAQRKLKVGEPVHSPLFKRFRTSGGKQPPSLNLG